MTHAEPIKPSDILLAKVEVDDEGEDVLTDLSTPRKVSESGGLWGAW